MKRFLLVLLVFGSAAAAGCGGGDEPAAERTAPTTTAEEGVAACWKDAAETLEQAAHAGAPVLRDELAVLVGRHEKIVRATSRRNAEALASAFQRFFATLSRVVAREGLDTRFSNARSELAACRADEDGSRGEPVPECWKDVALGYGKAVDAADGAVEKGGARVLLAVQNLVKAGRSRNARAFFRAEDQLASAMKTLKRMAGRYAKALGRADGLRERCAA